MLFNARTGRSDCLLVDAPARAVRLYPRNEERQETAVSEFWSNLIARIGSALPVLALHDGQRRRAVAHSRVPELAFVEATAVVRCLGFAG